MHIRIVNDRRAGVVTIVRIFEIESGRWLRDVRPEDEPVDEQRVAERSDLGGPSIQRPFIDEPPNRPAPPPPPAPPPVLVVPPPAPPAAPPPAPVPAPPPAPDPSGEKLHIPPGHLPELGECRVWIPGRPPGLQPKPKSRSCDGIAASAPAGSWILYRPASEPGLLHVRIGNRTRVFDLDTDQLVREENP